MKWLKTLGGALLAFLAVFAAATAMKHKERAKQWKDADEEELLKDIATGTHDAKVKAIQAKNHLDKAKAAESRTMRLLDKGAKTNEELDRAFDRFQSRAKRGMHVDSGQG